MLSGVQPGPVFAQKKSGTPDPSVSKAKLYIIDMLI
jgi:hypothetical protein